VDDLDSLSIIIIECPISPGQKMRLAKLGEKNHFFGKKHSSQSLEKMRLAHSGDRNHMFGKHHSPEVREKIRLAVSGENHPMYGKVGDKTSAWKGDDVGYNGIHQWVRENLQVPDSCEFCKGIKR
jgi:hypothetical protein